VKPSGHGYRTRMRNNVNRNNVNKVIVLLVVAVACFVLAFIFGRRVDRPPADSGPDSPP